MTPSLAAFFGLIGRDLRLAYRSGGGGLLGAGFFVLTVTMIPFGVGPELGVLARIAGGVVWVAALLAVLLTLDRVFQADVEDGSLDAMTLMPLPLEMLVLAKTIAHWMASALPVVLAAPLLALLLAIPAQAIPALVVSLLVGTPALSFIGAIGGALTSGMRRGGLLLTLLVLPLDVPVLIFGAGAVDAAAFAADPGPAIMLLAGISLAMAVVGPIAAAAALRLNLS